MPRHAEPGALEERLLHADDAELVRTPSVAADLASGLSAAEAARGQRARDQLRTLDTMIANAKAQIIRQRLLRGPSGRQFECDKDCVVGGCGETFAEEDGVLCSCAECQLFLCHKCFGNELVTNECQVGGRYDKSIETDSGSGLMSAPGSLPCPLYPSQCSCGHIPLAEIQRALLHESNRGEDGSFEDIESPGISPHKIFLIARRRQAETKLTSDAEDGSMRLRESTLVRTVTEARNFTPTGLGRAMRTSFRTSTIAQPSARAAIAIRTLLADKRDELEQLRDELSRMADDGETAIPPKLRRKCAQCSGEFTLFEGGQCGVDQPDHFLCNVCFGGYLMHACARNGAFEQAMTNDDGMVVSPAGKLPCPFFRGHNKALFSPAKPPKLDCRCGIMESSTIERVLMDPRNKSRAYWRKRGADAAIDAQAAAQGVRASDRATTGPWSMRVELLSREWTPSSVHETARLRVGVEADRAEQRQRNALGSEAAEADALAELSNKVITALTKGAAIRCPQCGVQTVKDDACIHMDTCPCRSSWCFLCGRISGSQEGQCPRGGGGCDADTYYLEQMAGWGDFALPGENAAFGAQQEFLRRRQAFYVKQVMDETDSQLWAQLREKSPGLLSDCPTRGRKIEWEELASSCFPLFGANRGRENIDDWLAEEGSAPADAAAAAARLARFEAHFRQAAEEEIERQLVLQRRRRGELVRNITLIGIVVCFLALMALYRPSNPRTDVDPHVPNNTTAGRSSEEADCSAPVVSAVSFLMAVPCNCGIPCGLLFWVPLVESLIATGIAVVSGDEDGEREWAVFFSAFCSAVACWPLLTGPCVHWIASLVFGPFCAGVVPILFVLLAIEVAFGVEDRIGEDTLSGIAVGLCCLSYGGYLGITIYARSLVDDTDAEYQWADSDFEISEYACTDACLILRYFIFMMAGLGLLGIAHTTFADEDFEGIGNGLKFLMFLLGSAAVGLVGLWPAALSMFSVSTLATGGGWWLYPLLFASISWMGLSGSLALSKLGDALGGDPCRVLSDYNLFNLIAAQPGALGCAFLYMYRAGIPEYEGAVTPWSTIVHVMITVCLVATVLLAALIDDDDDDVSAIVIWVGIMGVWLLSEDGGKFARDPS